MTARDDDAAPIDPEVGSKLIAMDEALAAGREPENGAASAAQADAELGSGLRLLRQLDRLRRQGAAPLPAADDAGPVIVGQRFGRFLVRRMIGRGGFGTVFLAFDPRLGREVALKVPHPEGLVTQDLRERFRREAQAAALLDHPHVVPVYEAGEIGPFCYLVSAYCAGGNLAQWLHEQTKPVPVDRAVAWVAQLADGVQHAHDRGIIHRDLKPANVLIAGNREAGSGDRDENKEQSSTRSQTPDSGHPILKVTDFGLAKLVDNDLNLTRTGVVVGTPQYMAPEQTTEKDSVCGPATDVYSLGVILYELLVGRPPFIAESALETLNQVRTLEPASPRRLRPTVARDVETICLKCLQKEPSKRYATAAELAADLRRFQAGDSIQARPIGSSEKVIRWSRRHPLSAGLIVALALSLLGGFTTVFWQLRRAEALVVQKDAERARAEKNYDRAKEVVERLSRLGSEIGGKPGMDKTQHVVFEEILTYYRDLLTERSDDPKVRREAARAGYQLASIRVRMSQLELAEEAYGSTLKLYKQLMAENPTDRQLRADYAHVVSAHAPVVSLMFGSDAALPEFARAIKLWESLASEYPDNEDYQRRVANSLMNWAVQRRGREPDEAEAALERALVIERQVLDNHPSDISCRSAYALTTDELGVLRHQQRRYDDAERLYRESLQIRQANAVSPNAIPAHHEHCSRSYTHLGLLFMDTKRYADAEREYHEASNLCAQLVKDHDAVPGFHRELANSGNRQAEALKAQDHWAETIPLYRRGLAERKRVGELTSDDPGQSELLARQKRLLGAALAHEGQLDEAIELLQQAADALPNEQRIREDLDQARARKASANSEKP